MRQKQLYAAAQQDSAARLTGRIGSEFVIALMVFVRLKETQVSTPAPLQSVLDVYATACAINSKLLHAWAPLALLP